MEANTDMNTYILILLSQYLIIFFSVFHRMLAVLIVFRLNRELHYFFILASPAIEGEQCKVKKSIRSKCSSSTIHPKSKCAFGRPWWILLDIFLSGCPLFIQMNQLEVESNFKQIHLDIFVVTYFN